MSKAIRRYAPGWALAVFMTLTLVLSPGSARAQLNSNIANVTLNATLAEQLTVAVTSGTTVNFSLAASSAANGDVPAAITTSWTLGVLRTSVTLYGYFDTPA